MNLQVAGTLGSGHGVSEYLDFMLRDVSQLAKPNQGHEDGRIDPGALQIQQFVPTHTARACHG
jgi:hypothetical protein